MTPAGLPLSLKLAMEQLLRRRGHQDIRAVPYLLDAQMTHEAKFAYRRGKILAWPGASCFILLPEVWSGFAQHCFWLDLASWQFRP